MFGSYKHRQKRDTMLAIQAAIAKNTQPVVEKIVATVPEKPVRKGEK